MSIEHAGAWEYENPEYGSAEDGPAAGSAADGSAAFPTPRKSDAQAVESESLPGQRADSDPKTVDSADSAHNADSALAAAETHTATGADTNSDTVTDEAADDETRHPTDDATWQLSTDMAPLPPLRQCLEAILLVVEEPVAEVVLAQITERPRDEVAAVLHELSDEYTEQQRGFDLRQVAGGWRLYTRASCAPLVEKFVLDGQQARLSQPALETLAVVAYRQPVSRSRISAVRGVNCDGVMRTLLTRGLVEEAGADSESGAILYRTTPYFLERMGMQSLDELPALAPLLPSIESMEEAESLV